MSLKAHRFLWSLYSFGFKTMKFMLLAVPLLMFYAITVWFWLQMVAIAANPGLLVTYGFAFLDLFPTYLKFAGTALWTQFVEEVKVRAR